MIAFARTIYFPMTRVSDYVAGFLEKMGVRTVFLVPGGFAMHLNDALAERDGLNYVCNHHEQASAMAADGYARQTGKLGVVMATSGPGATNLLTGIAEAWVDSIPLLAITGINSRAQTVRGSGIAGLRQFGFLEVDILPIVESVTKYAVSIRDAAMVRFHLEKAVYLATTGRQGPVLIEVPLDIQGTLIDPETLEGFTPPACAALPAAVVEQVAEVADMLRKARRPIILAGHGVRCGGAAEQFQSLSAQLGVPVVTTQMAKDLVPFSSPLFMGHPGLRGDRAGNFAVQNCDLLISLGCSLHNQTTGYELKAFAPEAVRVQVDLDPALLEKAKGVEVKVQAGCAEFLTLLETWSGNGTVWEDREGWGHRCRQAKRNFASEYEPHFMESEEGPASLYEVFWTLNQSAPANTTFLTDSGQSKIVGGQALQIREGQRYFANGGLGGMGWGLPAAIGVASAAPERQVVALIGDGSLQTNVHELQTLRHHGLNVKLIIVENGGYASIRSTQRQHFGRYIGADEKSGVSLPETGALAAAYGLKFLRCPRRGSLRATIADALRQPGPVICSVTVQPDQRIVPTIESRKMADGSMLSGSLESMTPLWAGLHQ